MFCLVYQSKANPHLGFSEIQNMLQKARESNQKQQITGCLLLYNGRFIQYLEGDREKVLILFEKIKNDIRNSDVTLLSQENISAREFEEWYLAFENLRVENSQLQYLKLLVGTFFEDNQPSLGPNPTSRQFWRATKLLLETKSEIAHRQ